MTKINPVISNDEIAIFDEEMAFLIAIQTRFVNMHNQIPVAQDDPDVKHLTEAMAAFMAKGRIAGRQQIDQLHQRVFQQLLPYLTAPVVSMALLQAETRYLSEATQIKMGSVFTLSSDENEQAQYRSICDMPLAPIAIERVGYKSLGRANNQIIIRMKAHTRVPGKLEHLPLFLNVNSNFNLSVWLKQLLQEQLSTISAVFDKNTVVEGQFTLGACAAEIKSHQEESLLTQHILLADGMHPVEKIRRFFQLPQQENYLNAYFSDTPQQWSSCDLILTLKGEWPRQLKLSADFFQLGVVSVENVVQEQAEPINYNATQSNCPIRPPSTSSDLSLLKCLGVYQGALKDRNALRPGILQGGNGAYDLHFQSGFSQGGYAQGAPQPQLDIQLPDAFKKPVKITVDALWHQPEFSGHLWKKLKVGTHHLDIRGLRWNIVNSPIACIPLSNSDPQSLLELSLLKNKRELSMDEIVFILDGFGSVFKREFQTIKPLLKSVHISASLNNSDNKIAMGDAHFSYIFSLHEIPANTFPLINAFFAKVEVLLNVWLADIAISVSIQNDRSFIKQTPPQSDQYYFDYIDTPIDTSNRSQAVENDYRLIPQMPEQLFFIGKENNSSAGLNRGRGDE
ncbi:MAG: type VI secretion system baseplate subunit TssF [Pseudomonadota bacterium]